MQKTILVVDDELNIRKLMSSLLEDAGFRVLLAENGKAALKVLKREKVDLAIVDFFMPGMSGRELCEIIRETDKKLKLIMLTVAQFGEEGQKVIKELKILNYISKPFENEALIRKIRSALK